MIKLVFIKIKNGAELSPHDFAHVIIHIKNEIVQSFLREWKELQSRPDPVAK